MGTGGRPQEGRMSGSISFATTVAAPAKDVDALVSDLARMGE